MTEEQIKQNAEKCVDGFIADAIFKRYLRDTYLAGAHSRDDEIKELQEELESLHKGFYERGDKLKKLMLENNKLRNDNKNIEQALAFAEDVVDIQRKELKQLRNPWISVDDRLPENNCVVFVSLDGTEYLSAHYRAKSKRFVTVSKDKQTLVDVRKSAATYMVCGDCIKEERFYSKGEREDITAIVTHWMLIPQIKKGE